MVSFFRSTLCYGIAGLIVMSIWSPAGLVSIGIYGGFLAAFVIIGPMWFMNHYLNMAGNEEDAAFVDMGLAIGVCGIMRDSFMKGIDAAVSSFPTMGLVVLGAVLGGIAAALIELDLNKKKAPKPKLEALSQEKNQAVNRTTTAQPLNEPSSKSEQGLS